MGNCTSVEDVDEDPPNLYTRQGTETRERSSCVVLSENPKLVYNSDHMLTNDRNVYGGKIFVGLSSKMQVLLKMIHRQERKKMEREISILSCLTHINIANILYPFDLNDNDCFLVTENFGANLRDLIGQMDGLQKMDIMLQLTDAVSYIQENQIVHLELCPRNVFINNSSGQTVKLINFHKAQKIKYNQISYDFNDYIAGYAAPEIIKKQNASFSSDIYSLGCLFFFIVTNGFEMHQMEYENQAGKVAARINTIRDESAYNVLCKDLIQKMLLFAPEKRISIAQVRDHPFFWTTEKMASFIVEISKLTEKDQKFVSFLFKGSKRIINGDWTLKLEGNVIQILQEIRQTYQTRNGTNQDDYKGTSILSLVKTLRNLIVHASNDKLVKIMGDSDEDFMQYWNGKFPLLICHLYKSKLDYDKNKNRS